MGCSPLKKGCFPPKKGVVQKKFRPATCAKDFFVIIACRIPLKISDRTLEKIPSQARTASSVFCFSCRFLLRLVVLVTSHTKPLESLNRGDKVAVPCYLIGGTWYIHWWNQYQRQWNRYQTWWNQYQIMSICYIITKI